MDEPNNVNNSMVLDFEIEDNNFKFASNISAALAKANLELQEIEDELTENIETIKKLTPECDKTDYILAVTSGLLCGILDIFLVGKPGESPVGDDITDKWFENRTKDFAELCGWNDKEGKLASAVKYLEEKFKIPYDQRGAGDAASGIFDLNPKNHHFKSLAHNPTLLGLFFSVLDQFNNTSHFVSEGELISLEDADGSFELCGGDNVSSKFFCAFVNWFGHLISDMSGSSGSKGRGMGIPSPLWSWANDIIVIKRKFNIPIHEFDKSLNEMAIRIYKEGYDTRFQAAQAIPVLINEMLVRLIYSIRRLVKYFTKTEKEDRTFTILWKTCEPFSNATVKRMLTVAHGTFCMMDVGDAIIQGLRISGGSVAECVMRINIIGVGRFTISLYGELKRGTKRCVTQENVYYLKRKRIVLDDYITGLTELAEVYDDKELISFVEDLKKSNMYKEAFEKTVLLANQRGVPKSKILESKDDIDIYFEEEMTNETKEKNKTSISAGGSASSD